MRMHSEENAVSPVVGIAVLVAIAVILSALVFATTSGFMTEQQAPSAGANVNIVSESVIEVQLDSVQNADNVYVQSPLGTRYELEEIGDTVEILNIGNEDKPVVIAERDGKEHVVQGITPRSFDADYVVNGDKSIAEALDAVNEGDTVVVKRGNYSDVPLIEKEIKLVAEHGTVFDSSVSIDSKAPNTTLSNVEVTGDVTVDADDAYLANISTEGTTTINGEDVIRTEETASLLRVTNEGSTGTSTTTNSAPTADAGADQTISSGQSVTLNASGSSDPDLDTGDSLSYEWVFDDGSTTTGVEATKTYSTVGTYTPEVTVTDSHGLSSTDAATITVQSLDPLVWSTASDWDNATSESGVVHASVANSDYNDASRLQMGYSPTLDDSGLIGRWLLQEDSSNTAYDFANTNNGSVNGPTQGVTGIMGSTAYRFSRGDTIPIGSQSEFYNLTQMSVSYWANFDTFSEHQSIITNGNALGRYSEKDWESVINTNDDTLRFLVSDGSGSSGVKYSGPNNLNTGEWYHVVGTWDGSYVRLYVNGAEVVSTSSDVSQTSGSSSEVAISDDHSGRVFNGDLADMRVYNRSLSQSEVESIYNTVGSKSSVMTATKSFNTPTKPDLKANHSLNSGSVAVTVTGSPGTPDAESTTINLNSQSSYDLTWNQSHDDYRVSIEMSTPDPTQTPTIDRIELSP